MRHPHLIFNPAPLTLAIALAISAPGLVHAQAATTDKPVAISIAAQPLDAALNELAAATGVPVAFSPALVAGKKAPAVKGNLTPREAVNQLLAGSGLVATQEGGSIVIKVAAASAKDAVLPTVTVRAGAERETATGPVQGYLAKRSATATKTDTPINETPQSVTIIGADQIETLKAQSITDAIAYSVGALRAPYTERTGDEVTMRGFVSQTTFRDGTRYQANRFDGQQEIYGLERIEVLKGASSVLYGVAEPGGILNTVSKRPTTERLRELNVEFGSFNRKQVSGDFAGALSQDGTWSYRLTGLKRESDTFIDHVPDNRTYIAPALKWQPNASTSVTLLSEYQRDHTAYGSDGLPTVGTVLTNINGQIPRNRFVGEPGYDRYDIERHSIGYLLEHAFSDNLKLRHSLRSYHMAQDWASVGVSLGLADDQRTPLARYGQDRVEKNSMLSSDTSLQYDWQAVGISHKTLVGMDYARIKLSSGRYERTAAALDLYSPVYGFGVGEAVPSNGWRSNTKRFGLYLQDQMKIADKWVLLLGGRHDRVRQTECDYFDPSNCYTDNEKSSATTGRFGVVYLADNGVAPFASFSQSFEPTTGVDRSGSRFKPTRGEQFELGVRYQPPGTELMLSAAAYELTQSNVLTDDPADSSYQLQQGEVRSRGVELEARGRVGKHLQILAAYTYTDARTTKASELYPDEVGKRSGGVPYNQLSLWTDYDFGGFGLPGLRLGAGARYVDETTSPWHDVRAPAYTVFDAMASYTTGPWRLALNITNLTDKTYVASCPYRCFYGEPRKVIGTVTYRW